MQITQQKKNWFQEIIKTNQPFPFPPFFSSPSIVTNKGLATSSTLRCKAQLPASTNLGFRGKKCYEIPFKLSAPALQGERWHLEATGVDPLTIWIHLAPRGSRYTRVQFKSSNFGPETQFWLCRIIFRTCGSFFFRGEVAGLNFGGSFTVWKIFRNLHGKGKKTEA